MTEITHTATVRRRGARGYSDYPTDSVTIKADTEGGQVTIQVGRFTETMILKDRGDLAAIAVAIHDLLESLDTTSQEG